MTVYARGSFGFQPVVGLTNHYWPPGNYEELFMGLPVAGQHFWGSFLVDGQRVVPIRQTQNDLAVRFLLFEGTEDEDLKLSGSVGFAGIADVDTRDSRWGLFQPGRKERFALATSENSLLWREDGEFEVVGRPIGDAFQLAIPDADEPFGYRVRYWTVDGTRDGHELRGIVGHEQVYVRPGSGWFTSRYMAELEQVWLGFVTEFDDGVTVHGHICRGRQGFKFAMIQSGDGKAVTTSSVECQPIFDDDGFPQLIDFELGDGSQWVYRSHGGGRMALSGDDAPKWREGVVTEKDEARAVVFSHCWCEAFPQRFS
jgi:hypothetical protein